MVKKKLVSKTKKVFTGNYFILIILLLLGLIPGLIYYGFKQGEKRYSYGEKGVEEKKTKEGLGISGFTLGILSIVLAGSIGILVSIVGFTFCMIQQKKSPMKLARIGIILNIIGFVISIILLIYLLPLIQQQLQNLPLQ